MEHVGIVLQEDAESPAGRCSPHTPFQPETAFISATICAATSPTRCRQPLLAPWLANNWPIMWFSAIGDNMTGDEHSQSVGFPDLSSASPLWWSMNRLRKTPILLRSASRLNLANGGSDPRGESWLKEKKKKEDRKKKKAAMPEIPHYLCTSYRPVTISGYPSPHLHPHLHPHHHRALYWRCATDQSRSMQSTVIRTA